MQQNLKRVRNVRMNARTSADLGWQVTDEFERVRQATPSVPLPSASHATSNRKAFFALRW